MMIQFPLWFLLGHVYAYRYTDRSDYDDENLEKIKIYKMI